MTSNTWRVSWYRFRTTFLRRRSSYVAIVLLVGVVGGVAMGSVIASRRTAASYNVFLAHSNPSDLSLVLGAPNLTKDFARLPLVRHVATATFYIEAIPTGAHGQLLS